ncbi:TonB-dependent siderophore receptor [Herbaspirillum camelliae]|uniref:TonB-dependent siderophore receptor n=1 Tax=Herbaspirillum camelliae TaxID=1892903 RepID=UPI00094A1405|nr:TonB-dependent receptor [Herbaspirillum camelliae]
MSKKLRVVTFLKMSVVAGCVIYMESAFAGLNDAIDVSMPSGDLAGVLIAISQQGHVAISFAPELVSGRRSIEIKGRLSVREALERVLAGSGLQLMVSSNDSVTVVLGGAAVTPAAAPLGSSVPSTQKLAAPVNLDAVDVVGVVDDSRFGDVGFQAVGSSNTMRLAGTAAKELPMTVNTVTADVIDSQALTNAIDALQNVAGVTLGSSEANAPTFTIRGFQSSAVYSDGAGVSGFDGSRGSGQIPIDDVERVDVLKGPTSILTGSSASGGAVNIVLKQPTTKVIRKLTMRYGTNDYKGLALDLGGPVTGVDHLTYRFNISGSGANRNYAGFDNPEEYLVSPAVKWDDGRTSILAGVRYFSQKRTPNQYTFIPRTGYDPKNPIIEIPRGTLQLNPQLHYRSKTSVVYSELSHDFGEIGGVGISVHDRIQYQDESDDNNTYSWLTTTSRGVPAGIYRARQNYYLRDYKQLTNQADITLKYTAGFVSSTTKFGLDYASMRTAERSATGSFVNVNPLTGLPQQPLFEQGSSSQESRYHRKGTGVGYYVLEKLDMVNNRLHLFAQARYDRNRYENVLSGQTSATVFQPKGMSWIAGGAYDVSSIMTLYANRSVGFLPINSIVASTGAVATPEHRSQYEFGTRFFLFDKRMTLNASYFNLQATNVSVCDPVLGCDFVSLVPGQVSKGFELDAQGEIVTGLNLIASFSRTTAEFQDPLYTQPLAGVPKYTASVWASYRFQRGALSNVTAGLGAHGNSSSKVNSISDQNTLFNVAGNVVVDAMLGYDMGRWSFQAKFNNILNKYYYLPSYSSSYIGIGEGRNFLLQAKYAFD